MEALVVLYLQIGIILTLAGGSIAILIGNVPSAPWFYWGAAFIWFTISWPAQAGTALVKFVKIVYYGFRNKREDWERRD